MIYSKQLTASIYQLPKDIEYRPFQFPQKVQVKEITSFTLYPAL